MSFSMSGGEFKYNRFDKFEKDLIEGSCGTKGYQEGGEVKCDREEKKVKCEKEEGKECKSDKCHLCDKKEEVKEGAMHRDAKTGEVVDKAEIGKIYYPAQPKKKTSVAKRKEEVKEGAKPDFLDLDKDGNKEESMKKAASEKADSHRMKTFQKLQRNVDEKRKASLKKEDLEATGLFSAEELEALSGQMTAEGALNPFQVHFDKDGKEYTSKGSKEERERITKNRKEMAKKQAKDAYKPRAGESD